jgi:hypothetical protein
MPIHFIEDYEELFGRPRQEDAPAQVITEQPTPVETKVVSAPESPAVESNTAAEVK